MLLKELPKEIQDFALIRAKQQGYKYTTLNTTLNYAFDWSVNGKNEDKAWYNVFTKRDFTQLFKIHPNLKPQLQLF